MSVKFEDELGTEAASLLASFPKSRGLPILACLPGSGAAAGGLRKGDLLIDVNGMPIDGPQSYFAARRLDADAMRVKVLRNGEVLAFTLQLESSTLPPVNARGQFVA